MEKREAITEITTVQSNGEDSVYIPFADGEKVQSISVKDKGVVATFRAVEGNAELGGVTTSKQNETISVVGVKTVCLIIETKQVTEFEIITIK